MNAVSCAVYNLNQHVRHCPRPPDVRPRIVDQVGSIPGNAAYFGGYELGRALVPSSMGVLGDMATGAIAQCIAGVAFTPVDIVKERLQV